MTENGWRDLVNANGEAVQIGTAQRDHYIFENGLEVEGDDFKGHKITQPPTDKIDKLRSKKRWKEAKLASEEKEFNAARKQYLEQANNHLRNPAFCPSVPDEAIACLERGRDRVLKLRQEIAEIDGRLPETRQREEEENDKRRQAAGATKSRNAIGEINI